MQRGDKGPEVERVQRELLALGYAVGAADGIAGSRTLAAYEAWERAKAAGVAVLLGAHEGRHNQGPRRWEAVTGITLHNTAGDLGERHTRWVAHPVRNPETGKVELSCLKAHVGVTRGGQVLLVSPLDQRVAHGHGLNGSTVGIECSGTYEGIEGDCSTWWRPPGYKGEPQRPTPELIEAARRAVRWICAEVAAHGGKIHYLYAHRQSRASRLSDPGQVLWREVALWAEREGLVLTRPGYTVGDGRAVPREWGGEGEY
jgi:hypothetical protein